MKYIVGLVVIIILAVGGYYAYQNYSGMASSGDQNALQENVQAQDTVVGTGELAAPGSIVSILYVGMLADGTVFDSSEAHNNEPLPFQLGAPSIIVGLQIGVNGMREGGERRVVVPPSLAYGDQEIKDQSGTVVIPANSTLVFDVKLVSVEPAPVATSTPSTQ